jgi:hypothetical protein
MKAYKIVLTASTVAIALVGWGLTVGVQRVRLAAQRTEAI